MSKKRSHRLSQRQGHIINGRKGVPRSCCPHRRIRRAAALVVWDAQPGRMSMTGGWVTSPAVAGEARHGLVNLG